MSIKQDFSGQYTAGRDELLLCEGKKTPSILLMLKGKIEILLSPFAEPSENEKNILSDSCRLFTLDGNVFLGVNDILRGCRSTLSLKADENSMVYAFPSRSADDIKALITSQKDYAAYIISSLATLIDLSYEAYQKLSQIGECIRLLSSNLSIYFWALKDRFSFRLLHDSSLLKEGKENYDALKAEGRTFFPAEPDILTSCTLYGDTQENGALDTSAIVYFSSLLNVPMDQRKGFFISDCMVCEYHIRKGSEILDAILSEIKSCLSNIIKHTDYLCQPQNGLIPIFGKIASELRLDKEAALTTLTFLSKAAEAACENLGKLQHEFSFLNAIRLEDIQNIIIKAKEDTALDTSRPEFVMETLELPEELHNSLGKILQYCASPEDTSQRFEAMLNQFRRIRDKTSLSSEERALRDQLTQEFFNLYEQAFKRSQTEPECPRLISMFLNYGYMDERLLTNEQTMTLYRLSNKESTSNSFSVYSAKQWLEQIYQLKKEPSINEFGQDYADIFREMKKQRQVSESDKARYDLDYQAKLNFEINNMLKLNQKVCHGHISSYFPILHKDIITRNLDKAVVTPERLEKAFNDLLAVDFSVFYREIWYKNDLSGVEKEPIMKEVRPDIIIVPTFGSRGSMWQEIAGRNRVAPGRFIVPAFTDEDIGKMALKLFGAFRWELCRTMAGTAWSDITEKSLTSEYTDYIQFYKNNNDLTEDAKEKIRNQVQRSRSIMREIFTGDYETWINYETKGNQRLNKVARSILMRYCTPSKDIRDMLARHPAYSDLVMQVNNLRDKTAKSLTSRYARMFKNGKMDKDIEQNLIFYRDM